MSDAGLNSLCYIGMPNLFLGYIGMLVVGVGFIIAGNGGI